jgi:acyl-CoA thioester hydrolase
VIDAGSPPEGAFATTLVYRVPFFDTDAMGVVHHANYIRYLELARVRWMDEHHEPYTAYVARGLHFAVTRVEADYRRAVAFDEKIAVTVWVEWLRGASLRMAYRLDVDGAIAVVAATEHAMVDGDGRVRRIPREWRDALREVVAP